MSTDNRLEPLTDLIRLEPVFILGVARSGTTLFSLMLDGHSLLAIPYESHFIVPMARQSDRWGNLKNIENRKVLISEILKQPYLKKWDCPLTINDIDLENSNTLADCISAVFQSYAKKNGKKVWGDKTPSYISDIDVLYRLFPRARFIHIIRDGRDVALSLIRQWWGPNDFISAMKYWRENVFWARKMLKMLPENQTIELLFEDLVQNPEKTIREVIDFLGWEFETSMLSKYIETSPEKVGDRISQHHKHLTALPSKDQAMKWEKTLSPADQAIAFDIAGNLLTELGYHKGVTKHSLKHFYKLGHHIKEAWQWRWKKNNS